MSRVTTAASEPAALLADHTDPLQALLAAFVATRPTVRGCFLGPEQHTDQIKMLVFRVDKTGNRKSFFKEGNELEGAILMRPEESNSLRDALVLHFGEYMEGNNLTLFPHPHSSHIECRITPKGHRHSPFS